MRIFTKILAVGLLAIATITSLHAHHGWNNYDATKKMTIKGPVLKSTISNPHASLVMAHDGADWTIILAPVARLESRGAKTEQLAVGKVVSVTGYPDKNGAKEMRAEFVTLDGADIQLR